MQYYHVAQPCLGTSADRPLELHVSGPFQATCYGFVPTAAATVQHSLLCVFQVDVLTVEIEHVDVDALESAAAQFNLDVEPTPHTLRLIQVCLTLPHRYM